MTAPEAAGTDSGEPLPLRHGQLRAQVVRRRREVSQARREAGIIGRLVAWSNYLFARFNATRPLRVWNLYLMRHGPLMAAGSAYNMFFSVAAMLVAGFAVFGLVASNTPRLQVAIIAILSHSVPGLIDTGSGGFVTPEQLFSHGTTFSLTLVVSMITLLLASLGWIAGLREGLRGIFGVPRLTGNFFLIKLKDVGILLLLAVALVLTSILAILAGTLLELAAGWLEFVGALAYPLAIGLGLLVMLLLDMAVAVVLFRLAARLPMSRPMLWQASLMVAAGSALLRFFASALLDGVAQNPLLAPFAVVLGLFVWFFFLSQLYLLAAAWGAVGMADARTPARTKDVRRRARSVRQQSRRLRGQQGTRPRHRRATPAGA
ncbi:YihY/virulence factor BrkB family protein [Arthrobacter sp. I2-34]|uniref:YihY/virulence factor BrkB family protein n=1 Tax=Arthrobacter hankyongi TaxID=2904801 RepID=A0ABS9L1V5_9MICC|nr:YihY/virulence factor BrkB family protein [Arthrobacter hankyongi]MCG2620655.1 YihY/virulence factor BrkB family protein [Arthrobacter hankyongi]